jgi:hypothetical protein
VTGYVFVYPVFSTTFVGLLPSDSLFLSGSRLQGSVFWLLQVLASGFWFILTSSSDNIKDLDLRDNEFIHILFLPIQHLFIK